jgi:hypothetical protein
MSFIRAVKLLIKKTNRIIFLQSRNHRPLTKKNSPNQYQIPIKKHPTLSKNNRLPKNHFRTNTIVSKVLNCLINQSITIKIP